MRAEQLQVSIPALAPSIRICAFQHQRCSESRGTGQAAAAEPASHQSQQEAATTCDLDL